MLAQNLTEEDHYLTILRLIGYFNPNLIASVFPYLYSKVKEPSEQTNARVV